MNNGPFNNGYNKIYIWNGLRKSYTYHGDRDSGKKAISKHILFYIYLKNVSASGFTLTLMSYKAIQ